MTGRIVNVCLCMSHCSYQAEICIVSTQRLVMNIQFACIILTLVITLCVRMCSKLIDAREEKIEVLLQVLWYLYIDMLQQQMSATIKVKKKTRQDKQGKEDQNWTSKKPANSASRSNILTQSKTSPHHHHNQKVTATCFHTHSMAEMDCCFILLALHTHFSSSSSTLYPTPDESLLEMAQTVFARHRY